MDAFVIANWVTILVSTGACLVCMGHAGAAFAVLSIPKAVRERWWKLARRHGWRSLVRGGEISEEDRAVLNVGIRRSLLAFAVVVLGAGLQVIGWALPMLYG